MTFSALFAFVTALSSIVVVNSAVIERDGSFTYVTPGGAWTTSSTPWIPSTSSSPSWPTTSSTSPSWPTTSSTSPSWPTTSSTSPSWPTTSSTSPSWPTTSSPCAWCTPTTTTTPCAWCTPTTTTSCAWCTAKPTTTWPATPGATDCNGVQQWQASFAYSAGDNVIFNDQLFTAKQWTYNNAPPTHPDQWTNCGSCSQPINNKADCNGVAAWQSATAYTTGNRVTFNGHLWSAVQWTQSNQPGDTSGLWKDKGTCA